MRSPTAPPADGPQRSPRQQPHADGIDAALYYLGMGLMVLKPGAAEEMQLGSFPTVAEMLKKTLGMGITVYVCEASKQMLGWETVELIEGVKIVGAATLNDLALDADATMWF
jgi:predicted peroxiredoxin